jgi:hypothetical protein
MLLTMAETSSLGLPMLRKGFSAFARVLSLAANFPAKMSGFEGGTGFFVNGKLPLEGTVPVCLGSGRTFEKGAICARVGFASSGVCKLVSSTFSLPTASAEWPSAGTTHFVKLSVPR